MINRDKLVRDIETLRESIKLNKEEMKKPGLTQADRIAIIRHGAWCMQELAELIGLLNSFESSR